MLPRALRKLCVQAHATCVRLCESSLNTFLQGLEEFLLEESFKKRKADSINEANQTDPNKRLEVPSDWKSSYTHTHTPMDKHTHPSIYTHIHIIQKTILSSIPVSSNSFANGVLAYYIGYAVFACWEWLITYRNNLPRMTGCIYTNH